MSETFCGRKVTRNSPADYERSTPGSDIAGSIAESSIPGYGLIKKVGEFFSGGSQPSKPAIQEDAFRKGVKAHLDKEGKKK